MSAGTPLTHDNPFEQKTQELESTTQQQDTQWKTCMYPSKEDNILSYPVFSLPHRMTTPRPHRSNHEQALRDASGSRFPIQCFGCAGLPAYENKSMHLFKGCPYKEDRSMMDNFKKNLQDYCNRRNNQRPRTWRQSGYPNKIMAALVKKHTADPMTQQDATLKLLTELQQSEMNEEGIGQQ
jgi:hypothetical protein